MCTYTNKMVEELSLCKSCKKMHYIEDCYKTCITCRERGEETRKKSKTQIIYCGKQGCRFKKSTENSYCMKHQLCLFEDETYSQNKKTCYNFIRGCRTQLENTYQYSKCSLCLENERIKDKTRRDNASKIREEATISNELVCTTCCKTYSKESFVGKNNKIVKSCIKCRVENKNQDGKRDKLKRNIIALKNLPGSFKKYIKDAKTRNIHFELLEPEFMNIAKMPCYYCGIVQDRGFNGIDRLDPQQCYTYSNCVSCCKICNYMKYTDNLQTFLQRIEHILTYQKLINGEYHPSIFKTHKSTYKSYIKRSIDKGCFLSSENYHIITSNVCYLCGKENTEEHHNGIDRFNNNIGYELSNCRSCCTDCNMMKQINEFDTFMKQLKKIYQNHICPP